jgi:hypothetical protein
MGAKPLLHRACMSFFHFIRRMTLSIISNGNITNLYEERVLTALSVAKCFLDSGMII